MGTASSVATIRTSRRSMVGYSSPIQQVNSPDSKILKFKSSNWLTADDVVKRDRCDRSKTITDAYDAVMEVHSGPTCELQEQTVSFFKYFLAPVPGTGSVNLRFEGTNFCRELWCGSTTVIVRTFMWMKIPRECCGERSSVR